MKRFEKLAVAILLSVFLIGIAGSHQGRHVLFQVSTINALMQGVFDGDMTLGELQKHGDFGLGTVNALDGEMIAVDGKFYQVKSDSSVHLIAPTEKTPFAAVTFFKTDQSETVTGEMNMDRLSRFIDSKVKTKNLFYAIRIRGTFDYIKARSVPRQNRPYPKLEQAVKNQAIFEFTNTQGVIVGLRCPDYASGINVPGYHFHFITDSRKAGGHVLDFKLSDVKIEIDYIHGLSLKLPEGGDFFSVNLSGSNRKELDGIEK